MADEDDLHTYTQPFQYDMGGGQVRRPNAARPTSEERYAEPVPFPYVRPMDPGESPQAYLAAVANGGPDHYVGQRRRDDDTGPNPRHGRIWRLLRSIGLRR